MSQRNLKSIIRSDSRIWVSEHRLIADLERNNLLILASFILGALSVQRTISYGFPIVILRTKTTVIQVLGRLSIPCIRMGHERLSTAWLRIALLGISVCFKDLWPPHRWTLLMLVQSHLSYSAKNSEGLRVPHRVTKI